MKLPQNLEGIYRDGSREYRARTLAGVEPMFLGGVWDWVKKHAGGVVKSAACAACDAIPNAALKTACKAVACR